MTSVVVTRRRLGLAAAGIGLSTVGTNSLAQTSTLRIGTGTILNASLLAGLELAPFVRGLNSSPEVLLLNSVSYLERQGILNKEEAEVLRTLIRELLAAIDLPAVERAIEKAIGVVTDAPANVAQTIAAALKGQLEAMKKQYESLTPRQRQAVIIAGLGGALTALAAMVKSFGPAGAAIAAIAGVVGGCLTAIAKLIF
jgi:hypothetical protein